MGVLMEGALRGGKFGFDSVHLVFHYILDQFALVSVICDVSFQWKINMEM